MSDTTRPDLPFLRSGLAWIAVGLLAEAAHATSPALAAWDGSARLATCGSATTLLALGVSARLLHIRFGQLSELGLGATFALLNSGLIAWMTACLTGSSPLAALAAVSVLFAAGAFAVSVPVRRAALVPAPAQAPPLRGSHDHPSTQRA